MTTARENPLSPIGLGCWALGGDQWGPLRPDDDPERTIRTALEQGITHFDTAQDYGKGLSEAYLGKTLKGVRDAVFIATKIFYTPPDRVEQAVVASIKRLATDRIDLLYIHWPKKRGDLPGMMASLEKIRNKGLVRFIGVSNFSVDDMTRVMQAGRIDFHQMGYNLLWRREERETIPFCIANDIKIITYSSLAEGILTGKFNSDIEMPANDHRKYTVLFDKKVWPLIYQNVCTMKEAADAAGIPLAHGALRWLLERKGVVSVLAGARNPEQVTMNTAALHHGSEIEPLLAALERIADKVLPEIPDEPNIFKWKQ